MIPPHNFRSEWDFLEHAHKKITQKADTIPEKKKKKKKVNWINLR